MCLSQHAYGNLSVILLLLTYSTSCFPLNPPHQVLGIHTHGYLFCVGFFVVFVCVAGFHLFYFGAGVCGCFGVCSGLFWGCLGPKPDKKTQTKQHHRKLQRLYCFPFNPPHQVVEVQIHGYNHISDLPSSFDSMHLTTNLATRQGPLHPPPHPSRNFHPARKHIPQSELTLRHIARFLLPPLTLNTPAHPPRSPTPKPHQTPPSPCLPQPPAC